MKYSRIFLFLLFLWPFLSFPQQETDSRSLFSSKITHAFSIQYENCIAPKAKFDYLNDPERSYKPIVGYGQEWRLRYDLIFPAGFGIALELVEGNNGYRHELAYSDGMKGRAGINDHMWILNPFYFHYWGVNLKGTYIYSMGSRAFLQPELGLNFSFYPTFEADFINEDQLHDRLYHLYFNNDACYRRFCPDLTMGINFLLHTKRDPRNNFVIGINANIGFVPRYKGWYSVRDPYTENVKDADITIGSTYVGFNLGYEFISVPKLYDRKEFRKELEYYMSFNPEKTIHSFSATFNNAMAFYGQRSQQSRGPIAPSTSLSYTSELEIKYNVTFPKGWGLSVGVPIGIFRRVLYFDLHGVVPSDTVWSNGAIGSSTSEGEFHFISTYSGITLKASYWRDIHRNVSIQPEIGIKILPLLHPVSHWDFDGDLRPKILSPENGTGEDIYYLEFEPEIQGRSYFIPQLTCAINFLVHGKRPHSNFIFGFNATIDFSKRMIVRYHSVPDFPSQYDSFGSISWDMSNIGLHIGYQFSMVK